MSATERKHPGLNFGSLDRETHEEAEEVVFGFWVFLMSDLVLFSLLFATYATMLGHEAGGPGPAKLYDIHSAAIETGALLTSSFTFGMASLAMKYSHRLSVVLLWLGITLVLGLTFLGFEINDFITMIGKGGAPSRSGFVSAFFALVGTHGLHVTFGSIWIIVMMVQLVVFGRLGIVKTRLLRLALFWHFLDIVWVGIFSLVYLQGLA
ncbi:cytochrome (ubi)quinol oxidase subunit III [Lichenicoccus sp.]|uniref:cytochrome (ubi)quinol oxidase subunit III n=1 Tax=Lichenicoccus sp. TaxID=2781899 RepID=UPI003D146B71